MPYAAAYLSPRNVQLLYLHQGQLSTRKTLQIIVGKDCFFVHPDQSGQDASITSLQAFRTLLKTGTQVELP